MVELGHDFDMTEDMLVTQDDINRRQPLPAPARGTAEPGDRMVIPAGGGSEAMAWQDFANCLGVDPDLFFPERGTSTREAKEVCRGCVVREDCLEFALNNAEKFGIWGGMSERERRRIRRQRSMARRAGAAASNSL